MGAKMTKKNGGTSGGNHEVGYGRPPKSGQIKPGEVRNPWGRTGNRDPSEDLLLKVANERIAANVNGKTASMSQEEALCRSAFQEALKGNVAAIKICLEYLSRRRPPLPPVHTPDEIAKLKVEEEERKALSAKLARLLDEEASRKKALTPRKWPAGHPNEPR
jgi:hypothetical protein